MLDSTFQFLNDFVFLYPLYLTFFWMIGGVLFFWRHERGRDKPPELPEYPLFSVLVPCHNEADTIDNTITQLKSLNYPNYEIIGIDDGSTDDTLAILHSLAQDESRMRVISLKENQGKATALNVGSLAAKGEFLLSIDADSLLDPDAVNWIAWHFVHYPRVGAVTGNPRVLNRSSLIGKIQTGEYATIIGLIKRTQRLIGKVLTVSGVVAAFRKQALVSVGFWDNDMVTEDIDITWKLEKKFWDVRYEPKAICWVLVPETLKGLWMQRSRWAQGGVEVLRKHRDIWKDWRHRRLWPIYIEYVISVIWAYSLFTLVGIWSVQQLGGLEFLAEMPPLVPPKWTGAALAFACIIQFGVSLLIERHYEKNILKYYFWVIWYPFCYWLISALTVTCAAPKALMKRPGTRAIWRSPDRGLRP